MSQQPNQMHPLNITRSFMETSNQNQTRENLAGRGPVVTAQVRNASTLRQQELFQQQQQQQQQLLEQQQQQQQQLIQQQQRLLEEERLEKERKIEKRVQDALNPLFLRPDFVPTTQGDPRAKAWDDRLAFMEMSKAAQRGPTTKQQPQPRREGGGRYNTKKKSKQSKRKSIKHKMQKKKTRRNRRLVK